MAAARSSRGAEPGSSDARHERHACVRAGGCAIDFVIEMLRQGFGLLDDQQAELRVLLDHTLGLAFYATLIALVIGLPIAYWIASGNSRPRRVGRVVANAGLGLPPVGVGVYYILLAPPPASSYLPFLHGWNGLAPMQAVLSLPIIVALCASAFLGLAPGLREQAQAFGASGWRLALFTLREAKVGVVVAVIVALGAAIGEVGAITIVAFNGGISPLGSLTTEVLYVQYSRGEYGVAYMVSYAIVLVVVLLVLGLLLTIVQQMRGRALPRIAVPRLAVLRGARS